VKRSGNYISNSNHTRVE